MCAMHSPVAYGIYPDRSGCFECQKPREFALEGRRGVGDYSKVCDAYATLLHLLPMCSRIICDLAHPGICIVSSRLSSTANINIPGMEQRRCIVGSSHAEAHVSGTVTVPCSAQ